jgi:1-acyl-sn-glycerol-3-phosphate acyltransferase
MVAAALVSMLFLSVLSLTISQLFLLVSVLNLAVNVYIFKIVPEFTVRFMVWMLSHSMCRVKHHNLENIPDEGAAVLVCNHIAMVDALLIAGAVRRPVRFVMYYKIFNAPVLSFIFRTVGAVPIAGRHEDKQIYEQAFARIAQYLQDGELVCIFPEGKLTSTGEINEFRNGIERIIQETPVPVVPMALQGMWGSFFSRDPAKRVFKRFWSRIGLVAGEPIAPEAVSCQYLQERVSQFCGGDAR